MKIFKRFLLVFTILSITLLCFPRYVRADCVSKVVCGFSCASPDCNDCCDCPGKASCSSLTPKPEEPDVITGKVYNPALPDSLSTLTGSSFLKKLLNTGISLIFVGGSVIFFFLLLSGGIRWVTGGGDKGKLEGAQKQITHALVGLAILLSSFAIIQLIDTIFGISLSNISLPTL